jgi:transposase
MEEQHFRKTYKYKLIPTPEQEHALDTVLWHCRMLYNTALDERKTAWERCHVSVSYYQQKAELPDLKVTCPEYAEVNAQVLQDVILRVERAYQAFFRRLKAGEEPGYPRFQGRNRYNSFTYPQYGGSVVLDGGNAQLVEDRTYHHSTASSAGGHAQDGHSQPRGRWLVRLHLVC